MKIFSNKIRRQKPKLKVKKNLASAKGLGNRSFTVVVTLSKLGAFNH